MTCSASATVAPRQPLALVLAMADDGTIGHLGQVPWDLPMDRTRFRKVTMGRAVIMGRRTWESLPPAVRPLNGRRNIVVSRSPNFKADRATVMKTLDGAIGFARFAGDEPFIIGGAGLYEEALSLATRVYLTEVHSEPNGDTKVKLDLSGWREKDKAAGAHRGVRYRFVTLERA